MQAAAAGDDLPVAADPPLIVTVKKFGSSETVDLPAHTAVTHVTGRYFENMDIRRLKQELKKRGSEAEHRSEGVFLGRGSFRNVWRSASLPSVQQ